jgi:Pentapeptide repeats (8 copies)
VRFRPARLAGGALIALLGSIAWAILRRNDPGPTAPPAAGPVASSSTATTHHQPDRPSRLWVGLLGAILSLSIGLGAALPLLVKTWTSFVLPVGIVGGFALLIVCIFFLPQTIAPSRSAEDLEGMDGLTVKDRIQLADDRRKLQNDVRTALLQGVAGGALLVGLLFTWQQQRATVQQVNDQLTVTRQGQIGERFSRAIGQLGSDKLDVRLGGIYELEQLARQADDRRLVIYEVLAAYTRQHAPRSTTRQQMVQLRAPDVQLRAPDVQAALTVLGRREHHPKDPSLDLSGVRGADLAGADLREADLREAYLDHSDLHATGLNRADLRGAELNRSSLFGAFLRGADLRGAHLNDADLEYADLRGADLRGAHLNGANLRGAHLNGAVADSKTVWPSRFDWKAKGVRQLP